MALELWSCGVTNMGLSVTLLGETHTMVRFACYHHNAANALLLYCQLDSRHRSFEISDLYSIKQLFQGDIISVRSQANKSKC